MRTADIWGSKLTIIIPTHNARNCLRQCLQSLAPVLCDSSVTCVVVDNASEDDSPEVVAQEFPQVILIRNDRNQGFARANNQVLERVQGEYALLLNDDTVVPPDTIQKMLDYMAAKPEVGMAGCQLLNPDGSLQISTYRFPSVSRMLLRVSGLKTLVPRLGVFWRALSHVMPKALQREIPWLWPHNETRQVDVVQGSFCMVRMKAVQQVGLLDETTFMYMEETDWARRFRLAGWRCHYVADVHIVHLGGPNAGKARNRRDLSAAAESQLLVEKYRGFLNYGYKHFCRSDFLLLKTGIVICTLCRLGLAVLLFPLFFGFPRLRLWTATQARILSVARGSGAGHR